MSVLFENMIDNNIACALIAVAGIYTIVNIKKVNLLSSFTSDNNKSTNNMSSKVKEWMEKDFKNKIIKWKRDNPNKKDSFSDFIKDVFPENIKTNGNKVIWIDRRMNGNAWKGTFRQTSANDKLIELGKPPGT